MPDRLHIRAATLADAESLALLAERSFRDTFAADNSPEDMEAYCRDAFSLRRVRAELEDPASTFLLAFRDGASGPIGYARLRTGDVHPAVIGPAPIELHRLYVDQGAIGHGVGAALMRACLDAARSGGYATLWLGVWEHNARALAFYRKWGFEAVGNRVFRLGSDDQTDFVMARPVV